MKNKKNYLDEMQDRKLLKIEEIGFWLAFWGLVIAIALQFLLGGTSGTSMMPLKKGCVPPKTKWVVG